MSKTINKDTERARYFIRAYKHSIHRNLSDCYKSYSIEKQCAFDDCIGHCILDNGVNLKIISSNIFYFTVAYLEKQVNKDKVTLHIITKFNEYVIKDIDVGKIL